MNLELITWNDHSSIGEGSWIELDLIEKASGSVEVKSVGYVVKETDDFVVLVSTLSQHGLCSGNVTILKPTITKRKKLR